MSSYTILPEVPWLWAGLGAYGVATYTAIRGVRMTASAAGAAVNRNYEQLVLLMLFTGVALLGTALGVRWERLGHGPFVNLFELLMSQLFSLGLVYSILGMGRIRSNFTEPVGMPWQNPEFGF